jgi:hypothetical protein
MVAAGSFSGVAAGVRSSTFGSRSALGDGAGLEQAKTKKDVRQRHSAREIIFGEFLRQQYSPKGKRFDMEFMV